MISEELIIMMCRDFILMSEELTLIVDKTADGSTFRTIHVDILGRSCNHGGRATFPSLVYTCVRCTNFGPEPGPFFKMWGGYTKLGGDFAPGSGLGPPSPEHKEMALAVPELSTRMYSPMENSNQRLPSLNPTSNT